MRSLESHKNFCTNILTAIGEIVDVENIGVSAPTPSKDTKKAKKIPISFPIYNITHKQAATLLKCSIWSSRVTTFRVAPFVNTCPSFFFTLRGYTTITAKDIFIIVKEVWDSEHTKSFISTLSNSAPATEKEQVTLEMVNLLDSLSIAHLNIKEVGNTLKPCFNVYTDSSNITYDKLWMQLRAFLTGQTYASAMEGQGIMEQVPYICTCCHGVDHPQGLCPLPGLMGWNRPRREGNGVMVQCRMGGQPFIDQHPQRQCFAPLPRKDDENSANARTLKEYLPPQKC